MLAVERHTAERKILRVLTDAGGKIPTLDLHPGLYRTIATAPYGLWQTEVQEFVVGEKPMHLALRVRPMPTHGSGDIVTIGTKRKKLKVLKSNGQAASGAEIYIRDRGARRSSPSPDKSGYQTSPVPVLQVSDNRVNQELSGIDAMRRGCPSFS
jgi:hypothetical protein